MSLAIKRTNDGSYTLYNEQLDETYHSIHGARQEASHVFIKNGLNRTNQSPIRVLEVGLGTGLNVLLTYMEKGNRSVEYIGLEPFPISPELLESYISKNSRSEQEKAAWLSLMSDKEEIKWDQFSLEKYRVPILNFKSEEPFDLIYFDAFAPSKQVEMWQPLVFEHLASLCRFGSRVVTYCAQGQFKRNLSDAGFVVETLPGPPGKREMTTGIRK